MKVSSSLHTHTQPANTTVFYILCPVWGLFYMPHLSLLMFLETQIGLTGWKSPANIHFPKYGAFTASQWPRLLQLREEHVEEWPATTFIHSIQFDCKGGVDVFSKEMTALFDKLKSGETSPTPTPRSTYEICLYAYSALKDMIERLSGSMTEYTIRMEIPRGKLMKLID